MSENVTVRDAHTCAVYDSTAKETYMQDSEESSQQNLIYIFK